MKVRYIGKPNDLVFSPDHERSNPNDFYHALCGSTDCGAQKRPSETAISASKGRYVSYSVTTGMPRLLNGSGSICTGRFTSNSGLYFMPTSEYFAPAVL